MERDDIIRRYKGESNKIFVVPPGVNHKIFKPVNPRIARKKIELEGNKKIILFVGRIDPIKGISLLVRAVGKLVKLHSQFCRNFHVLLIGGEIEDKKFWKSREVRIINSMIKKRKLESCIKFIGSKPHSQLPYYYSSSTVVVMPSYYESFGFVVLEALACEFRLRELPSPPAA